MTFAQVFTGDEWNLLVADMHSEYGIEIDLPGVLARRSWDWFRVRVIGVLAADTRLHRLLNPPEKPKTPTRRR